MRFPRAYACFQSMGGTESGNLEQVYQHGLVDGVLAFCGMHDAEEKPILLGSCKDNGVYLYDLPSFVKSGNILSRRDVQSIEIGPHILYWRCIGISHSMETKWRTCYQIVSMANNYTFVPYLL